MLWNDQGVDASSAYGVVPRILVFALRHGRVLLLRGQHSKRLWAGQLNGIGGHVEPGESLDAAARREFLEETGLALRRPVLGGLVHASPRAEGRGVLLFVFVGSVGPGEPRASCEGALEWHQPRDLPDDVVGDLPTLIPRVLNAVAAGEVVLGHYVPDGAGDMTYTFAAAGDDAGLSGSSANDAASVGGPG